MHYPVHEFTLKHFVLSDINHDNLFFTQVPLVSTLSQQKPLNKKTVTATLTSVLMVMKNGCLPLKKTIHSKLLQVLWNFVLNAMLKRKHCNTKLVIANWQ